MDGKGRATDNSRTERFFRALKYECIYLNEFENPRELRKGIAQYIKFYNTDRPHQSLNETNNRLRVFIDTNILISAVHTSEIREYFVVYTPGEFLQYFGYLK